MHALPCGHVVHAACSACLRCTPKPLPRPLGFAAYALLGAFGASEHAQGKYRRAVMLSSTFGTLWALDMLCTPLKAVVQPFDFLYCALLTYGLPRLFPAPPEFAAALALWIAGEYGFEFHPYVDFPLSVTVFTMTLLAFRAHDQFGSTAICALVFYLTWRPPTMWDFHCGNCCGLYTALLFSVLVSGFSALVVGSAAYSTFQGATLVHAWILCRLAFPKQTRDPFNSASSELIRAVSNLAGLLLMRRGRVLSQLTT
jgi:hypothetical protein